MHTEGHDMGKDVVGNAPPMSQAPKYDAEHPGYEIEDVNTKGVAVFLAGLFGTVILFFGACYVIGMAINNALDKYDGKATKWTIAAGAVPAGKGDNLKSNAAIQQEQLQQMTTSFPQPRLDTDDGNEATTQLHAREDLLLEHYSKVDGQPDTIRIPIERAMELIAQRGLPVASQTAAPAQSLAEDNKPEVRLPLTSGFARTGYELNAIETRKQQMTFAKAEGSTEK